MTELNTIMSNFYKPRFHSEDIRMQIHKILPVTCVVLALSVPVWAQNTRYDFDYRTTDQRVQVFDDGKVTRIQFPEGTPDPTIVAVEPKGEILLKITKEAPHVVLNGIYSRLVMRWGNRREVQAVYNGSDLGVKSDRTGSAAAFGVLEPQVKFGSVAKPIPVPMQMAQQTIPSDNTVPAVSRMSQVVTPSAQLPVVVATTVVETAKPVAVEAATIKVSTKTETSIPVSNTPVLTASTISAKKWQVEVKDITLANTFARWATDANQKIRWDADKHVLVEAPDTLTGSFEDVVTAVLSSPGIAQGPYPLEVCFYPNNPPLARVTRKGEQGKECK